MTWIKFNERKPSEKGWYKVVKFIPGTEGKGFFSPIPPAKRIEHDLWDERLKHEQTFADRVIYKRIMCFIDQVGIELRADEILYWYELDPIPEGND